MCRVRRFLFLGVFLVVPLVAGCSGGGAGSPARLASPQAQARGRTLFERHCSICHGVNADGKGPRSAALEPPPTDFSDPAWGAKMPPQAVFLAIREGVAGTSMPAWPVFDKDETWDLVAFVRSVAGK
jgi:high-affinity iron transporter